MSDASNWGARVSRAWEEANGMYPNQPERARRKAHDILGMNEGPYDLEPLTIIQRIEVTFGTADHAVEIPDLSNLTPWGQFKRGLRFFFTGA